MYIIYSLKMFKFVVQICPNLSKLVQGYYDWYIFSFRQIDEETFKKENVTKYGGRDACGNDEWKIDDHAPTQPTQVAAGNYFYFRFRSGRFFRPIIQADYTGRLHRPISPVDFSSQFFPANFSGQFFQPIYF